MTARKLFYVVFTEPEANHLLTLLHEVKHEGTYYGQKQQYYARTNRIIHKLEHAEDGNELRVCQHIGTEGECPR